MGELHITTRCLLPRYTCQGRRHKGERRKAAKHHRKVPAFLSDCGGGYSDQVRSTCAVPLRSSVVTHPLPPAAATRESCSDKCTPHHRKVIIQKVITNDTIFCTLIFLVILMHKFLLHFTIRNKKREIYLDQFSTFVCRIRMTLWWTAWKTRQMYLKSTSWFYISSWRFIFGRPSNRLQTFFQIRFHF